MADDLFDIANLITTVGVDGVKIKSEPGLPEKSSNEILTELFSTFNAVDDDVGSSDSRDQQVPNGNVENVKSKIQKKKKKKKHKHKEKKSKKKKSKHNSSDSNSDAEGVKKKKKKEHKKKSKRRRGSVSSRSSESEPKAKAAKLENDDLEIAKRNNAEEFDIAEKTSIDDILTENNKDDIPQLNDQQHIKKEPNVTEETADGSDSPCLPPISKKTDEEVDEPIISRPIEKSKQSAQGKILIKDLKNSVVYSETVKAIEDKQKAKAEGVEEGEISDSSSEDNREHNLNLTPFRDRSLSFSPNRDRTKSTGSTEDRLRESKADLRLVLREKDKKRRSAKDKDGKRSTSHHSQDRRRSRSRTQHNLHRSRSNGRERQSGRSRERRDRSNERHRHRSHSRSRGKYAQGRSRSRERKERIEIDKKKLLEIARKNAINMIKQGTLPLAQKDKAIAAIQSGGKTVDELTDFCKSLSKSEELGELSSISSEGEESESEKGFHHPFLIKERPSSIIMNIRDAKQLPTKTFQEKTAETSNQLRLQFPVSSGQHHRRSENEWVPVTPVKKPEPKKIFVPATSNEPFPMLPAPPMPEQLPPQPVQSVQPVQSIQPAQIAQITQASQPSQVVFPTTTEVIDIGSIVSERLAAMRRLKEDPNDVNALNAMQRAQNEMRMWAESKQMPGQFTGSTGVKVLTPAELSSGCQAWTRKDQLVSAQPVSGGMGMALLQKMGWRPGEGLGKNKEGALEPLQIEVKLDKRGLVSEQDIGPKLGKTIKPVVPTIKTLEGKHPVSLLGEYCSKKKLGPPAYELCFECGPDHRKNFLFKVKVNGIEYKPSVASPNKKQAKAEAAQICLQSLGLLPT